MRLKFEYRKAIHYTLLCCVIILQMAVIFIWYHQTSNEDKIAKKFDEMAVLDKLSEFTIKVNNSFITSQGYFYDYLNTKDEKALNKYTNSLKQMSFLIDSLESITKNNNALKEKLLKRDQTQRDISLLKHAIDSVLDHGLKSGSNQQSRIADFTKFESEKIIDSIKVHSTLKIDSIAKKGLLARLGSAIAGKTEIQKEQLNIIVTMKYKNKVVSGSLEEQIANLFAETNAFYKTEFDKIKSTFSNLREKDQELIGVNKDVFKLSQSILPSYINTINDLQKKNKENILNQYEVNKSVRSYHIVILILLMLFITIMLLNFTRISFDYEKRLTIAQQKISQSLSFKNRIMGMISHEIRSPLSIISIYSSIIDSMVKEKEAKEVFKSIEFTTNSLLLLANQILAYSKDENRKFDLQHKEIMLKSELDQIISSLAYLAESKGNKVEMQSNIDANCKVYSDAGKIHQLFYNIIGNANKFTKNGLILVVLDLEDKSNLEYNLKVSVKDNGIGIADQDLKNIFESYYQGMVSEKVYDLGVGLGLNLCREIVTLFGGEIHVESQEGKGTTITFNLLLNKM
ncbi:HAMP domain-containing sensor histidine kinase [Flavobacterium sp. Fl-77]|uniref:histidine kinase n=1 Tax=Flavobacterium flavipigmentatum TaxID=2893884 RepID=A0AAJ2SGE0_9FLAO|nr:MULTISPECIES: HAMP domain-containing sensor histidine kinase [unclassified Flavobacterium]MDX6182499.1 HAMP domain-containing sensor histidine kinase [Flavobacterium sp. Fl-33]MDX6185588.1 HAMP domain-containing sensor histidine kinase [Flavobacterium sp. Fl-77]UFH38776.1 HAMP domain-containing histidine kinase [Flavobacterium sp. F-70]